MRLHPSLGNLAMMGESLWRILSRKVTWLDRPLKYLWVFKESKICKIMKILKRKDSEKEFTITWLPVSHNQNYLGSLLDINRKGKITRSVFMSTVKQPVPPDFYFQQDCLDWAMKMLCGQGPLPLWLSISEYLWAAPTPNCMSSSSFGLGHCMCKDEDTVFVK